MKTCTCCGYHHKTLETLKFIGENFMGPHYNCNHCGSTLIVKESKEEMPDAMEFDQGLNKYTAWRNK